jgi:hypothetical protein
MRKFILLAMLTWAATASALDTNYTPFAKSEMLRINATRATTGIGTRSATGKHIVATIVDTETNGLCEAWALRIAVDGTNVFSQALDFWTTHTETFVVDLDGNGLEDVVKQAYYGSQGFMLGCDLMIFSQYEKGKFAAIKLPAERFTADDICNLDNKGRKEIVTCVLVGCGGHNYWVYRCWNLSGSKLVSVDKEHGFPRAVWFTEKPNRRLVKQDLLEKIMANYPTIPAEEIKLDHAKPSLAEKVQSGEVVSAVSWNGRAVSAQTRDRILALIRKEIQSFTYSGRDCRVSDNGPMAQLAPSRTIMLQFKDGSSLELSLFVFNTAHKVLQAQLPSPETYWSSTEKKLIEQIEKMEELK